MMKPLWISSATTEISFSFMPLVVSPGVPNLIPYGFIALLSPGTKTHKNTIKNTAQWISKIQITHEDMRQWITSLPVYLLNWIRQIKWFTHITCIKTEKNMELKSRVMYKLYTSVKNPMVLFSAQV